MTTKPFTVSIIAETVGFRIGNQSFRLERHNFSDAPEEKPEFLRVQAEMLTHALDAMLAAREAK